MPIECSKAIIMKDQEEFHAIDNKIMKLSFDIHNEYGRFYDEQIYHKQLKLHAENSGFNAESEVVVKVNHKDFSKYYYLDLLIEHGVIYELKAVTALNNTHEQQLINYLLLTGLHHGKLINFRPMSVEKKFCSNRISINYRMEFNLNDNDWDPNIARSQQLKTILKEILNDWGTFLDFNLYKEALIHFLGGKDNLVKPIDIVKNSTIIGQQKIIMLNNNVAIHISGIAEARKHYVQHMYRFLEHTNLNAIQWINFNQQTITLTTIKK